MRLLPLFFDLSNRDCLVVGSGKTATRYANELLNAGACVTRMATASIPDVQSECKVLTREFNSEDSRLFWVVVAANEDANKNKEITSECHLNNTFCVNISEPAQSSCHFPVHNDQFPPTRSNSTKGVVSLVGAGPGDPELLTLRALRLIQSADVIVYDRLVNPTILDLRRADTKLLYAGKEKSEHSMPQQSINELLVSLADEYQNVVRLKGGDPFIFGRGGEELETLAHSQVTFQVVPGITAASGCASFAGIPLTHRDHAQSCVFLTGHLKNGEINLNWQGLTDTTQTIVIYMGLTGLRKICEKLIENGRSPMTPAALIERGTTLSQRIHTGSISTLADIVEGRAVRAPTLLIIGQSISNKLMHTDNLIHFKSVVR